MTRSCMRRGQVAVPFLDVAAAYAELRTALDAAFHSVMERGWFILGPEVEAFETEFAAYVGARHCVGVGNGLDALELAMRALGVEPGDEIIVPAHTYVATWLAVSEAGGIPVPVDCAPDTFLLDATAVEAAVTPRTRGILPVHLYGHPADMVAINAVAARHGLWVLEDAAQAHGSRSHGRRVGAIGTAAGWSFYPGKNLGCFGDGGAVTTNDAGLADRLRLLRSYGAREKYKHLARGVNSRLDELQAAFLRVRLRHLEAWNHRRIAVSQRYLAGLSHANVRLPMVADWAEPVWHIFALRARRRDALQAHLAAAGIVTLVHYPIPPHAQPAYQDRPWPADAFPNARDIAAEELSLPMGPHLTPAQVEQVVTAVGEFGRSSDLAPSSTAP